jgi:sugar phosphate permease
MGLWSLFCGLTAGVFSFTSAVVIRVLFGVGEGPFSTTANKLVNNWFPHRERASAVGVLSAGTPLGGAVAGPVVGYLTVTYGWRLAFIIVGILGFIWLALWLWLATDNPSQHSMVSDEERKLIAADKEAVTESIASAAHHSLGYYLRQPLVWATAVAFFGYNYILFFFLTWFPSYLTSVHQLSIKSMSIATVIPWVLGFVGLASGGFLSDWLFKVTGKALLARKIVLVSCLLIAFAGAVSTVESAVGLMSTSIFFLYLTGHAYWAIIQDTVRGENVGSVGGFVHFLANLAGIIGPTVTGFMVQLSGSFISAFVLAGGIALTGATAVMIFVPSQRFPAGEHGMAQAAADPFVT